MSVWGFSVLIYCYCYLKEHSPLWPSAGLVTSAVPYCCQKLGEAHLTTWRVESLPPNLNVLAWNCYLQFDVPSTFHPPRRMKQEMLIVEEKAPTIFTRSHASLMLRFQMWEHVQSTSFLLLLEKCGNLCTDHVNTRTQTAGACSTGQVFFLLVFWTREEFLSAYL